MTESSKKIQNTKLATISFSTQHKDFISSSFLFPEYSHMSTHLSGFQSIFSFFTSFCIRMNPALYVPHGSGPDAVGVLHGLVDVVGDDAGCQAVRCVISSLNHLIQGLELDDTLDRTKNLGAKAKIQNVHIYFPENDFSDLLTSHLAELQIWKDLILRMGDILLNGVTTKTI